MAGETKWSITMKMKVTLAKSVQKSYVFDNILVWLAQVR